MADILQTASEWLEEQRTSHMTTSVTYQRGEDSVLVSATVGRTKFETDGDGGIKTDLEVRDYLILAEDLELDGTPVEPAAGDKILEVGAGKQFTYEVMSPTTNEPAWRFSDPYHQTYRIHTKLTATEDAA